MKNEIRLNGKWEFIGAEIYRGSKWVACGQSTMGMTWDFHPQYFGKTEIIGSIIERLPKADPVILIFAYNLNGSKLSIERYNDLSKEMVNQSIIDIYKVVKIDSLGYTDPSRPTIKLCAMQESSSTISYFCYILQKI